MASSTWHRINVVCFCLTLLVQRSGSVLATNEVNVIPASVQTSIGSTITLDCTQAQNTSVLWFQDDKQLPTTTQQLILSDVSVANKGIYKCCLKECSAGNSATSTVDIGEGPRQPLDLTCECRDYMNINCSWTMSDDGDAKSNISMRIQDYDTLKWHNLPCKASNDLPQDKHQYCFFNLHDYKFYKSGYVYKIRSANKYGEAFSEEVNFHLAQQAMPYPPDDVIIQALSSNSVNVTWCEPPLWAVSQARRLEFKVEYKPEGGNKWVVAGSKKFGPGEPRKKLCTSMKIHSLEPYTSYCTQIRARKDSSSYSTFSEPSNTVCATTMEDDPGKPWDVKYRILPSADDEKDTRSVSITWKPVHKEERNGIILGYRIVLHGVHGSDETNTTRLEYNVTGTNLTVHGLDNYRTYTITVQAFNSAGMSWEKASPDGPIPVAPDKAGEVSHIFVALMVPIAIVCLVFMSYCIWHRGKKILKPTYDIQIPERARNDNLYVTTVNFRMQESECFDELKAPPNGYLHVDLPPNGECTYGNGACPTSDYSEDPCTPGLPSSENFPLLSGHMIEANQNGGNDEENKMLTVDCGEGKALLDGHPYADVGYNHTGSPLSVASGGSYWTTGEENESVSYHRMSPKGLALCEADEQWEGARGAAGGEPSSPNSDVPDSPSRHMDYSMMGKNGGPTADSVASPKSPTSPVALYSMQASALDPVGDEDSVASEDDPNDISSYVQQTTASSLGLLVPVPQTAASNVKNPVGSSEIEKKETENCPHAMKDEKVNKKEGDTCSVESEECLDDGLDSYVRTGVTNAVNQSPKKSQETPAVENYVRASCDRDTDVRRVMPRMRSASGGALDGMRRTHSSAPDFLDDSDSAISMEDADLQYVQAGFLDEANSEVPPSPVLPGVAIDFPSDGSGDIQAGNTLAPADADRRRSLSSDRRDLSDNDLSDAEYERYNDDSIDGYVTQAHGLDINGQETCPMLPYVAIDLAEVPQKSPAAAANVSQEPTAPSSQQQQTSPRLPQPVCIDSGYVPQNQALVMGATKDESQRTTAEKSAYDNPEYGVLAHCLSELEKKEARENRPETDELKRSDDDQDAFITSSNENLTGSPTNNNSPYVPHGKAPLGHTITKCPSTDDTGYLPHGKIPGQALPQKPDVAEEVNRTCAPAAQGLPSQNDRGYIPINNIPAM